MVSMAEFQHLYIKNENSILSNDYDTGIIIISTLITCFIVHSAPSGGEDFSICARRKLQATSSSIHSECLLVRSTKGLHLGDIEQCGLVRIQSIEHLDQITTVFSKSISLFPTHWVDATVIIPTYLFHCLPVCFFPQPHSEQGQEIFLCLLFDGIVGALSQYTKIT